MTVSGKAILLTLVILFSLSVLSAIVVPAGILYLHDRTIDFGHLSNLGEFVLTYFIVGPPILTAGALAGCIFLLLRGRIGTTRSAWVSIACFLLFSIVLTYLAIQVVIEGFMFIIESAYP